MNIKLSLGEIVSKYPTTIKVMNHYKLDYCCGGKDTLEKAIKASGEEFDVVLKAIESSAETQNFSDVKDWTKESLSNIIDYILDTHHVFMRDTLEELNTSMFKILKVHYKTHGESLLKIHHMFGLLKTELEAHLVKEEENLFPLIKEYEKTKDEAVKEAIFKFINDTEDEHDAAGDIFKNLSLETDDYTTPEGACFTYNRVYELLNALEKDTFNHIHMENSVLFTLI